MAARRALHDVLLEGNLVLLLHHAQKVEPGQDLGWLVLHATGCSLACPYCPKVPHCTQGDFPALGSIADPEGPSLKGQCSYVPIRAGIFGCGRGRFLERSLRKRRRRYLGLGRKSGPE